ncbi:MAG: hypothetical protein WA001_04565 [Patescibacteria group bacterium]
MQSTKLPRIFSKLLLVLSALLCLVACSGGTADSLTAEKVGKSSQRLNTTTPPIDDLDSYTATDQVDGQSGGQGWHNPWAAVEGAVYVSDAQADTGSLSFEFGATGDDVIERDLLHIRDHELLTMAIKSAVSYDSVTIITLFDDYENARFQACLSCSSLGWISAYNNSDYSWYDLGEFDGDNWNQLGLMLDADDALMDVYLGSTLLYGGITGSESYGYNEIRKIQIETQTYNGELIYLDSIEDHPFVGASEGFEDYTANASLDGLSGGQGWATHDLSATPTVSSWEVLSGTATVIATDSHSGTNSLKLTGSTMAQRELQFGFADQLDIAFKATASLSQKVSIELPGSEEGIYMENVKILLNDHTAGQVSISDGNGNSRNVSSFNNNAWNTLSIYNNNNDSTFSLYVNGSEVASEVPASDNGLATYVLLSLSSGQVEFDEIQQTRWYDDAPE